MFFLFLLVTGFTVIWTTIKSTSFGLLHVYDGHR